MVQTNRMDGGSGTTRLKMRLARIVLLSGSILVSLALGEMYLRIFPPKEFRRLENLFSLMRRDNFLGVALRPNVRAFVLREDGQDEFLVETNSYGIRDEPYSGKNGRQNILGLGDSYLFGDGVNREETMLYLIQRRLDERYPGAFRTINAGVPSYSTNQEALYYMERGGPDFEPAWVLLFFYVNDGEMYIDAAHPQTIVFHKDIPVPDPELIPRVFFQEEKVPRLEMIRFMKYIKKKWRPKPEKEDKPPQAANRRLGESMMFLKSRTAELDNFIDNMYHMIGTLDHHVRSNGSRLIFVYIPAAHEAEDGESRQWHYKSFGYPREAWDWNRLNTRMIQLMERIHVDCVDLMPAFEDHWRKTGRSLYLNGRGHFTPEGNRLAAEVSAARLTALLDSNRRSEK